MARAPDVLSLSGPWRTGSISSDSRRLHGSSNCDGKIPVGSKVKTKKTDSRPMIPYLRAKHNVFRN